MRGEGGGHDHPERHDAEEREDGDNDISQAADDLVGTVDLHTV